MSAPPVLQGRVLPTLNQDGTRRRIRPKLYEGAIYRRRLVIAWALIVLFVGIPFVNVGGRPFIFLDVIHREFTFVGRTFFATDGVLLMLLMLGIFVGILWVTALLGRVWCGYGCPQTVYMEFLFRPIERLFEGNEKNQKKLDARGGSSRRTMKYVVFAALSVVLANVFLAYFVGVATLRTWVVSAPGEHWGGFVVMGVTAALVFFDFAYFREQMCTVICPYARLQSALLDRDSLLIAYDGKRGEPRKKGKWVPGGGDCIDCGACVTTCPTGIDIREGLQLECIACGQCADACDTIMPKIGRPLGLIRYATERGLVDGETKTFRPRVILYSILLSGLFGALFFLGTHRRTTDVTVLRGIGAPYVLDAAGVRNQVRVKLENRKKEATNYRIEVLMRDGERLVAPAEVGAQLILPENPILVTGENRRTTTFFLVTPGEKFKKGQLPIVIRVLEPNGVVQDTPYKILGPFQSL